MGVGGQGHAPAASNLGNSRYPLLGGAQGPSGQVWKTSTHRYSSPITFVDETTGTHTNTIESTCKHVKAILSPYNRKADYVYFLAEHTFGQKCKAEDVDRFCKFFEIVASIDWSNTNSTDSQ